jgi:hypothetical protein
VRFYLVLSVVVAGIGGLWYASQPIIPPYMPPSPAARAMLERAAQQADAAERAEQCHDDGDY